MPGYGLADWVSALGREGYRPRESGGGWSARCPCHDDKRPSLTLRVGDKREVVAHCHAGCRFEDIRGRLGLDHGESVASVSSPADRALVARKDLGQKERRAPQPLPSGRVVTSWVYTDAGGNELMAVVRKESSEGKRFSQWTPAGSGWISEGMAGDRPLYRLPELTQATGGATVVEGEKCADTFLRAWPGQTVTTWAGGTGSWRTTDWSPLAGRDVTLLADADEPGRKAMREIAAHLDGMGCTVQVALPEGETGEDVADWLGVSKQHARERVAGLLQTYVPTSEPEPGPGLESRGAHQFEFSPVADAWRLLQAHADRILLAEGTDKRGAVERTALALDDAGLWHNDGELLAAWHAELAGELILDTLACSDGGSKPYGFAKWSGTALRPGGAEQCRKSVASVVLAARERDDPPPEGLTECHTRELNPLRYLGAPNGVIDLTTGRLLPPVEGRRCLVTFSLPDPYDPDVTHPDVEQLTAHLDSRASRLPVGRVRLRAPRTPIENIHGRHRRGRRWQDDDR